MKIQDSTQLWDGDVWSESKPSKLVTYHVIVKLKSVYSRHSILHQPYRASFFMQIRLQHSVFTDIFQKGADMCKPFVYRCTPFVDIEAKIPSCIYLTSTYFRVQEVQFGLNFIGFALINHGYAHISSLLNLEFLEVALPIS